jgi:hypothetical protein
MLATKPKKRKPRPAAKRLWDLCKTLIRERYGNECYTCRKKGLAGSDWHTGHFIAKSICSTELAYDLMNLRPQCYACNVHRSGNWIAFEARLIEEHGLAYVDELKRRNQATKGQKFGTPWLEAKIIEYQALLG